MKPYYQDSYITIYCGDCFDIMPQLEPVDLVVTDPPYGFNAFGDWTEKEAQNFWDRFFDEGMTRNDLQDFLIKPGGSFYSFTGWKFYPQARLALTRSLYLKYLKTLIWDKRTFTGTRGNIKTLTYHNISEPIIFGYRDDGDLTFNLEDIRVPTIHGDKRSNPKGKRPGDIISEIGLRNNAKEKVEHKGQKPLKVIKLFIKASSNKNETILDPFMGSGTTLVAAKQLERKAIGIEIEEKYCEIAVQRLRQEPIPF